ncbi:alpha/beta hydrolase [Streptosporangiaceae bacterium NEAU-GS5]|nr:alpha/beta hydrolase [Streptosporangiaceae bacterium NEAU-GS5]
MTLLDLADGRKLDIAVSGPSDGIPLVFHHGTPGSVLPFRAIERATHARGLRLVTYSRAGYGRSTRLPGRSVVDIVADARALLDHLGVRRCLTAGWSGGGPHALAMAARLPDQVAAVAVLSGVAPYDAEGLDFMAGMGQGNIEEFGFALEGEQVLRAGLETEAAVLREAEADDLRETIGTVLSPIDRSFVAGEPGEDLAANIREGLREGPDGWIDDDLAFVRPWGFDPGEVGVPAYIWQGAEDLMVPFEHGRWLAAHVPGATAHLDREHGHLSMAMGRTATILDELLPHL